MCSYSVCAFYSVQVYVYFAGACVCLLTSGVCHLLGCCQQHITEMVWRFDYAGIAVLIVASFVPAMYYAFLCEPFWRNFYLLTTVSMGEFLGAVSCQQQRAASVPFSWQVALAHSKWCCAAIAEHAGDTAST
jgi:predicted membrane channel-forming protein YqfA (hemolysin III family)